MFFLSINRIKPDADIEKFKKVVPLHIGWVEAKILEGVIIQSGKWGNIGGMAILKAENIDEAKTLLEDDPLIKSGLVTVEIDVFFPDVEMKR